MATALSLKGAKQEGDECESTNTTCYLHYSRHDNVKPHMIDKHEEEPTPTKKTRPRLADVPRQLPFWKTEGAELQLGRNPGGPKSEWAETQTADIRLAGGLREEWYLLAYQRALIKVRTA
ncbi:hypothetical protein DAPPUDRAFT_242729 [Daphnia pulex]|uniref:Uncharacterized protein n=1 Tax=Daphnia pulex TaxID=6669 RepID=E9GHB4_DAPPU|nr:hypothetical protein DAPPUDRAFT_242729 [Daphnia pulex]|eukprot:EFX81209.1 hypothetical protein DAPPUDRAFT_242729 [Daphnia pulex]